MNMLARLKPRSPLALLAAVASPAWLFAALLPSPAMAHPASQALDELQGKKAQLAVIQNKFFLKTNRFEITPAVGYVPNNDLASVPVGGIFLAYHFSESFAAEGSLLYGVDTGIGGLKGLTTTLLQIGLDSPTFQQPIDRTQLAAIFDARFAPVYGKINLIGEGVINFDFYGTVGAGLLVVEHQIATNDSRTDSIALNPNISEPTTPYLAVNLGVGFDFFLTQSLALKLDARTLTYIGQNPDYGDSGADGPGNRIYNSFITTGGISIFVPKMKPRLSNF